MLKRKASRGWVTFVAGVLVLGLAIGIASLRSNLRPVSADASPRPSPLKNIRVERSTPLSTVLVRLERDGVIRSAWTTELLARWNRRNMVVPSGTYAVSPRMSPAQILESLQTPIRQMVRLPETNWARRNANLLERKGVCTADEYLALVRQPEAFQDVVSFPLPKGTLEGYLYPDTYELPPQLGARGVIERQLRNFERRVWEPLGKPADLHRLVLIGSLVELEVKFDAERAKVAGVIENRLRIGMPLQIDASINYALQEWRPLLRSEYRSVVHPHNLYLNRGLPPSPVCSPTVKSIRAAQKPAAVPYLYYVAMPDGTSVFATNLDDHERNFQRRKRLLAEQEAAQNRSDSAGRR